MPAWLYPLPDDHGTAVAFAPDAAAAARAAGLDPGDVRRHPAFDRYETAGRLTDGEWLAEGWTVACAECEHRVSGDGCAECNDDPDREPPGGPVVAGDVVYCSAACRAADRGRRGRVRDRRAAAAAELARRLPGATVTSHWTGCPGECRCFSADPENQALHFTFPGATRPESGTYCAGCRLI